MQTISCQGNVFLDLPPLFEGHFPPCISSHSWILLNDLFSHSKLCGPCLFIFLCIYMSPLVSFICLVLSKSFLSKIILLISHLYSLHLELLLGASPCIHHPNFFYYYFKVHLYQEVTASCNILNMVPTDKSAFIHTFLGNVWFYLIFLF